MTKPLYASKWKIKQYRPYILCTIFSIEIRTHMVQPWTITHTFKYVESKQEFWNTITQKYFQIVQIYSLKHLITTLYFPSSQKASSPENSLWHIIYIHTPMCAHTHIHSHTYTHYSPASISLGNIIYLFTDFSQENLAMMLLFSQLYCHL